MKKIRLTLLATCLCAVSYSQNYWKIDENVEIDVGTYARLGTYSDRSINFVTHDTTRLIIDSLGAIRIPAYATEDIEGSLLMVGPGGGIVTADGPTGGFTYYAKSSPCYKAATPWYLGGNSIVAGSTNDAGTCNDRSFRLMANSNHLVYLDSASKFVGIGPDNYIPGAQLDVTDGINYGYGPEHMTLSGDYQGIIKATSAMHLAYNSNGNGGDLYIGEGDPNGTFSTKMSIVGGNVGISGNVGIGSSPPSAKLGVDAGSGDGISTKTSSGSSKSLRVLNGSTENFVVHGSGKTHIGAKRPLSTGVAAGALLSVDGMILARDIRVAISTTTHWVPDYVFEKKYKPMSLDDVEKFVQKHKHLPDIPGEKELLADGMDMTTMNLALLKKVEELYLHTIDLNKKIRSMEEQLQKKEAKK